MNHHTLTEVTLAKENQSKNLEKVEVNGTDETNDTSIFVEVEVKLNKSDKETENEIPNDVEVVQIPKGSSSLRLSSNIYCEKGDSPYMASPGIYKKGACTPPPTELQPVINHLQSVINEPPIEIVEAFTIVTNEVDGTDEANDTPVFVEAEVKLKSKPDNNDEITDTENASFC